MKFKYCILFLFTVLLAACGNKTNKGEESHQSLSEGLWEAKMFISEEHPDRILPFQFSIAYDAHKNMLMQFMNGGEEIPIKSITETKDSLVIEMPVFQSVFKAKKISQTAIEGLWYNLNKKDYSIPFQASTKNAKKTYTKAAANLSGNWEVSFDYDTEDAYPAVGIFKQNENDLEGSFLTETGDYRFLYGKIEGHSFWLATFDGAHAFLFEAELSENKEMTGTFYSGKHYKSHWKAVYNENAKLQDANSLTYLTTENEKPSFRFPNTKGTMSSLEDEAFQDKVLILQLMGSWCPNCMDETRFYNELYHKYHSQGLEIIGLGFEYSKDSSIAMKSLEKMEKDLEVPYTIVHAGSASKKEAAKLFPMLNHVISFPTSIFLDRKGNIRKIHTGFNGPGTGKHYETYSKETHLFIQELLEEKAF